uniref:Uncharacterized protein n=1 Tax=Steinernema glaseri TaxID=37863 RepID=A0A1I8ALK9_9BILA
MYLRRALKTTVCTLRVNVFCKELNKEIDARSKNQKQQLPYTLSTTLIMSRERKSGGLIARDKEQLGIDILTRFNICEDYGL